MRTIEQQVNSAYEGKLAIHSRENQEALSIWEALKQAEANGERERMVPLLVFKRNRSETYVVMKWVDFLNLHTAVSQ